MNPNDHGKGESNSPSAFRAAEEEQQQAVMAFVGAISDLFNCGRPRRPQTREELRNGANTNPGDDTTRADPVPDIRIDASHSNNSNTTASAPSDAIPQLFLGNSVTHFGSLENRDSIEGRPSTVRPSTDAIRSLDGRPSIVRRSTEAVRSLHSLQYVPEEIRTLQNELIDEKSKTGSGWQVEKQFLVTTNAPDASDAAPKLSLDFAEASVVDLTPTTNSQDGTSTPPIGKTEESVADLAPATETQDVTSTPLEKADSKVDEVHEAVVEEAVAATNIDQDHPFLPEPLSPQAQDAPNSEALSRPQSQELPVAEAAAVAQTEEPEAISSGPVSSEEEIVEIQPTPAAPAKFLVLPIGM
jgi:hypothetical protein